ncbi:hypothetical protein AX14_002051 [Amanita brunnescens Koide BX004]|nr:hypothetical protein AX14_002051 [Amanita brunnescens Koide BX004]
MVAATVSAIPNIPMQTAIATAIDTVRAAGPAVLTQSPITQPSKTNAASTTPRPKSPASAATTPPSHPQPPADGNKSNAPRETNRPRSRAPSPSPAKPAEPATMTFAQMAASVLHPPNAPPMHPAKVKPSWRAIETNKSLVLRPGTKGTRVSELHIRVPKVSATTHLFSLSGTKLINEILRLVNESHNKAGIRALKENHLVLVKWSMRGNLIFKCSKPMDDIVEDCLHEAIKSAVPPSSADSIAILNKPPTTALKFSSVPRHNEDGTDTDSYDLHNDLMAKELWRDVEIFSQPRFLLMKPDAAGGTVIVSVVDDNTGSALRADAFDGSKRRLNSIVCNVKHGGISTSIASQTLCAAQNAPGHMTTGSTTGTVRLARQGNGISVCLNCVFYVNRSSKERQIQLRDEFSQKWKEEEAALKAAANTDSGRAARSAVATGSKPGLKDRGKAKTTAKKPTDDSGYIPVGKGGKSKYSFGGMADALASTTRIDVVDDNSNNTGSDASSELRLSYLDDLPLKQCFPALKPPTAPCADALAPKPLTIMLPAPGGSKPLRSVTDILRELKIPNTSTTTPPDRPRFGGGDVVYTASALQNEASEFAAALATSNVLSQPSPQPDTTPAPHPQSPLNVPAVSLAPAAISQSPTNLYD